MALLLGAQGVAGEGTSPTPWVVDVRGRWPSTTIPEALFELIVLSTSAKAERLSMRAVLHRLGQMVGFGLLAVAPTLCEKDVRIVELEERVR